MRAGGEGGDQNAGVESDTACVRIQSEPLEPSPADSPHVLGPSGHMHLLETKRASASNFLSKINTTTTDSCLSAILYSAQKCSIVKFYVSLINEIDIHIV